MRYLIAILLTFSLAVSVIAQGESKPKKPKKKSKKERQEEITQVLPLPKDLPLAVTADTDRLVFHVSPLSAKGLLSQQTRDAVKALWSSTRGAQIVKLRAFVAGSGDTRRVATIVSEMFEEKRLQLPALTTVQVGSLGLEGAQIVLESTALDKKKVNPAGLAFISGQQADSYAKSVANLKAAVQSLGLSDADILRSTCFVNSWDNTQADRQANPIPGGSPLAVQMRRELAPTVAECEAVARLKTAAPAPVELRNPDGLSKSPNYSQIAVVTAPRIVLTGLQMAFHTEESDAKLAFERLGKTLEAQKVSYKDVFFTSTYALSTRSMELVRGTRFGFLDKSRPPASTLLPFEGLPSLDASFGIDVIAVAP